MDEREIAENYGCRICIRGGFDVQKTIPFGTPENVRKEARTLMDTFYQPEGRFMVTCGNELTEDTPIESFEALLDESYHYGSFSSENSKKL